MGRGGEKEEEEKEEEEGARLGGSSLIALQARQKDECDRACTTLGTQPVAPNLPVVLPCTPAIPAKLGVPLPQGKAGTCCLDQEAHGVSKKEEMAWVSPH